MKIALLAILLVTPLMLSPQASAWSACSGSDSNVILTQGAFYVRRTVAPLQFEVQIWQESNGVAGLQIDHCVDSEGFHPKDAAVLDTGVLPPPCIGFNPLCIGPGA